MESLKKAALTAAGVMALTQAQGANALVLTGLANLSAPMPATRVQAPHSTPRFKFPTLQFPLHAEKPGAQPAQYEGVWHCLSRVTASNVAGIAPGQEIECTLNFSMDSNNRLLVHWQQNGWNPADCSVVNFSPTGSTIVHKSICASRATDWEAKSHDSLKMLSYNQMRGHSQVTQYRGGQAVGSYETVSELTRIQ